MREGHIAIYYGKGKGKTSIAVGRGMRAIGEDLRVVMIQFMDYHNSKETALLKKMEPDFRVFRFEKDRDGVDVHDGELDEHLKKEIGGEIRNAFNFAKKIVDTGECEMLSAGSGSGRSDRKKTFLHGLYPDGYDPSGRTG